MAEQRQQIRLGEIRSLDDGNPVWSVRQLGIADGASHPRQKRGPITHRGPPTIVGMESPPVPGDPGDPSIREQGRGAMRSIRHPA